MKIECKQCKNSFHRGAAIIIETGPHYKVLCPSCKAYVRFITYRDKYKEQLDNGMILEHLYFGAEGKNVTAYTADRKIDFTAKVKITPNGAKIEGYSDMSGRILPVPNDIATKVADIISKSIEEEFGIDIEELTREIKSILLEDRSEALKFLHRARKLANDAMSKCAVPAAA